VHSTIRSLRVVLSTAAVMKEYYHDIHMTTFSLHLLVLCWCLDDISSPVTQKPRDTYYLQYFTHISCINIIITHRSYYSSLFHIQTLNDFKKAFWGYKDNTSCLWISNFG